MTKQVTFLLAALMLATTCSARNHKHQKPYTEGSDYIVVKQPKRFSPKGKVEVVEVFSYDCIHCYQFSPYAEKLRASLPAGVAFHSVPASFTPAWEPFARAFYAAQQLGVLERTHTALFKQKFYQHYPLNSLDDLADFYAREGIGRATFMRAANSDTTKRELERNNKLIMRWGVEGTPTIVVDGKYRSGSIDSYDTLVKMTQWLVERELRASTSSH